MKITTKKDVWLTVLAINALAGTIVVASVFLFYPKEQWLHEFTLGLTLTFMIATPVSYFMAQQIRRIGELSADLQHLLDRDRLTDVATRDFFFNTMEESPDAHGVSLMVDIDNFKKINDTYGHLAGDLVIKRVAQQLRRSVRNRDIVARFGGEEFVIFMYGQDPHSGREAAERMRERIADLTFCFKEIETGVTVSIGGSLKDAFDDVEDAIRKADEALYRAKENGRNQTVFASSRKFKLPASGKKAPGNNIPLAS